MPYKKKPLISSFVLVLLLSTVAGQYPVDFAAANPYTPLHLPKITINGDGTINPQTTYLNRIGNTYSLTGDISHEYAIEILCSNMVFDGAGHTINVTVDGSFSDNGYPAFYVDVGINLREVHNVIVKNVTVFATNNIGINLQGSSNCQIVNITSPRIVRIIGDYNTITQSNTGVSVFTGSNNLVTENNLTELSVGTLCYSNRFFKNTFYLNDYPAFFSPSIWDNGSVGNYWSNYTAKYPEAKEVGNSGIGDTPYIIQREPYTSRNYPNIQSVDNYPLMYPWGTPQVTIYPDESASKDGTYTLNFTVNKPYDWAIYSIDGQANVTITGNTTLNGMTPGAHNLTLYVADFYGAGTVAETVNFVIPSGSDVLPTLAIVIVIGAFAAIGLGFFFIRRRQSHMLVPKA